MAALVPTELAFAHPRDVSPDPDRPGLSRARTRDLYDAGAGPVFDRRRCGVRDCSADPRLEPTLDLEGFSHLELGHLTALQSVLDWVRVQGRLAAADIDAVRNNLRRARLALPDGRRLRILHVATEGFIMRRAGPDGLTLDQDGPPDASNNHHAAAAVHVDQDVDGTPVRQILRGLAPRLFHHESPLHANRRSPLYLLNLWIPLQQATAPLTLVDGRSLDRRRCQVRFGLPVDEFMNRPPDRRINDIWTLLHDDAQRWYFDSAAGPHRAWVFETLSTPHAAFTLPGEGRARQLYEALDRARSALRSGELGAFGLLVGAIPPAAAGTSVPVTEPLRRAVAEMESSLAEMPSDADQRESWDRRAARAMDDVVRKSIEMRLVALVTGPRT